MKTKKEYMQEYYKNNKDKWKVDTEEKKKRRSVLQKEYSTRHKKRCRDREHIWIENNYERVLYNQAKRSSKPRGLSFSLGIEDILIPTLCPYLEIPLTKTQGKGIIWSNASIDRIDNTKGYIKGNIQIISRLANSMKQQASKEELIVFAKNILRLHDNN